MRKLAILMLLSLTTIGMTAIAHPRNYEALTDAVVEPTVFITCIDDLTKFWFIADPLVPDVGGTCFQPGHLAPQSTLAVRDEIAPIVGAWLCQDRKPGNGLCDPGDFAQFFCNQVVLDPQSGWDPNLTTWVFVQGIHFDVLIGSFGLPHCAFGEDDGGTIGAIDHN